MVGLTNTSTSGFSFGQASAPQTGIVSPFNPTPVSSASTAIVNPLTSATTGFSFNPSPSIGQTGFGTSPAQTGFGTSAAQTGFGTSPAQTGFGISTAQPGFGTSTAQTGFGISTAQPGFGTSTAQPGFGTSSAQPGFGTSTAQPGFGTSTAQPGFGTSTAQPGFGASTAQPGFGASTAQPGFGTSTAQPSFGASTAQPGFGASTAQPGFGASTAQPGFGASTAQPGFGASTAQPGFGTSTAQPGFGSGLFANPASSATTSTAPGLGGGFSFSTKPSTVNAASPFGLAQSNISNSGASLFNQAAPASAAPPSLFPSNSAGGFSIPGAPSTSQSATTGFSIGLGLPASGSSTVTGLGGNAPTTSTLSQSCGLGGIPTTSAAAGTDSSVGKTDGKSIKESPLPQDIFSTVAEFETYRDSEKKACEENIRQTAAPFHKLVEDANKLRQHITQLSNQHQQLHTSARKMKTSVVEQSSNVEMAIRTHATPASLQGDNKAPELFFLSLVKSFEEKMTFCRTKIDEVDNCSRANSGKEITHQDLKEALKWEHESVKQMAARVYTLHSRLTELHSRANRPSVSKPEMLFKPTIGEDSNVMSSRASAVLRPCFSDVSGLFEFQTGQQKAKSISLGGGGGAAPPTLSLNQTSIGSNLFGSSSMFASPNQNNSIFGQNTSFGASSAPSPFGSFGQQSNNSTLFGNLSATGGGIKVCSEQEESQRKRRI